MKPTYIVQYWNAGQWNTAATFACGTTSQTWDKAWYSAYLKEAELKEQGYSTRVELGA